MSSEKTNNKYTCIAKRKKQNFYHRASYDYEYNSLGRQSRVVNMSDT